MFWRNKSWRIKYIVIAGNISIVYNYRDDPIHDNEPVIFAQTAFNIFRYIFPETKIPTVYSCQASR